MENSQNYSTDNRIYKFSQDGNACIIKEPRTPRYWYNYLWNENRYCAQVSQIGHGCSYYLSENADMCIHGTHSDTPVRLLKEIYGKPFQAAIAESGLKGIMPSYNSINGEPMSASYTLLKTFLRDEMLYQRHGARRKQVRKRQSAHCLENIIRAENCRYLWLTMQGRFLSIIIIPMARHGIRGRASDL